MNQVFHIDVDTVDLHSNIDLHSNMGLFTVLECVTIDTGVSIMIGRFIMEGLWFLGRGVYVVYRIGLSKYGGIVPFHFRP